MDHYPNAKTSIIAGLTLFGVALWQIFALISKVSLSGTFPQNTSGLAADLCYILLGLGILSLTTSARAVTLLCAGATAALALSNVMCSNWPASFNCTEWFGLSFPISLSLTILAAALALARSSNMRLSCHIFAIMSLAFAVVALIGYTYGFDLMATVGFPSEFNLKNGVLTAIAGVGVISATASGGLFTVFAEGTLGAKMVRMMLPAVLIIPFFGLLSGPGQHEPIDTLVLLGLVIVGMPILILSVGRVLSGIEHDRNRAQAHIEAMNQVLHGQVRNWRQLENNWKKLCKSANK